MSTRLKLVLRLSLLIFLAVSVIYVFLHLYVWNRVTLSEAEQSTLSEDRLSLFPVEGRLAGHQIRQHVIAGRHDDAEKPSTDDDAAAVWNASSSSSAAGGTDVEVDRLKTRSMEYCNRRADKWTEASDEGRLLPGYRLIGVVMVTRHGDRSPMYTLPNHVGPRLSCSLEQQRQQHRHRRRASTSQPRLRLHNNDTYHRYSDDDRQEDSNLEPIDRFVVAMQSLLADDSLSADRRRLFRRFGLYPNSSVCYGAQLTADGAAQMFRLGRFLRTRYPDLAGSGGAGASSSPPEDDDEDYSSKEGRSSDRQAPRVYVRSTEYPRTFQSAAALLYGFAGRRALSSAKFETTRNIYFCSEESSDVGRAGKAGAAVCNCPVAARLLGAMKRNRTYSVDELNVRNEVAEVFNVTSSRLPWMSAMMEVFMAYACHSLPLPCGPDANRCITWRAVDRMWSLADAAVVARPPPALPSPSSGTAVSSSSSSSSTPQPVVDVQNLSSRLLSYPLLREIAQRLVDMSLYLTRRTAPNVVIYSGHDKTVSTLARTLGVFDDRWPPYASRLVVELHASASRDRPRHFVRVLYNGRDVTAALAACRAAAGLVGGMLCPLDNVAFDVFQRFTTTAKDGRTSKTYAEACGAS